MRHARKWESIAHKPDKKKSIKLSLWKAQTLHLLDKELLGYLDMFKELKEMIFKELMKSMRMMSHQIEKAVKWEKLKEEEEREKGKKEKKEKGTRRKKKKKIEILELKRTITENKSSLEGLVMS